MALRSLVDVAIHFESFRNVDLFHQGLYHLKARIYNDDGDQRLNAIPLSYSTRSAIPYRDKATNCHLVSSDVPEVDAIPPEKNGHAEKNTPKVLRRDHHSVTPACVIEEDYAFCTKTFLIRYCEEEVDLNELAYFRIELSEEHLEKETPLTFEIELMFVDLSMYGGADRFEEYMQVASADFESICTQTYRIHGAEHGMHEFVPVVFDEMHFCVTGVCIHTTLLDIRFRLLSAGPSCPEVINRNDDMTKSDSTTMVQRPDVPTTPQHVALSLSEYIFADCPSRGREDRLRAAEGFFQQHLQLLAKSYAGLLAWFQLVLRRCLTEGHRQAFGEAAEDPDEPLIGSEVLPPFRPFQNGHNAFREYVKSRGGLDADEDSLTRLLADDLNRASCQILGLWYKMLHLMHYTCSEVAALLRISWEERMSVQWSQSIVKQEIGDDVMVPSSWLALHDVEHAHSSLLSSKKPNNGSRSVFVEDVALSSEMQPVIWEQRYGPALDGARLALEPKEYRGVHLWVFVHGFQGNSFDMRLFRNNLALLYPEAVFLTSTANEENTDGDFNEMGIRLAQEVINFISEWCPGSSLGKLSFIGYSIGGIIIRTALPLLHEYHKKMYTYISLTSMHLGYLDSQTTAFNTVLYALAHWRKIKCIQQLSMNESSDPRESFLYKLSMMRGLENFQWICLLSSKQDNYSPILSSGAAMNKSWENSTDKYKEAYRTMCRNFWEPLDPRRVIRIGAHFHIAENNLDSAIGRVAHIRFIENQPLMKMLLHSYSFLFR